MNTNYSFSEESKSAIGIAEVYAKESMSEAVTPGHLLKAVLHKEIGLVEFLENIIHKDYYYLLDWANARIKLLPKSSTPNFDISFSDTFLSVVEEAENYRESAGFPQLEPIFLLAALVTPGVGFTFEQLKTLPLSADELLASLNKPKPAKEQRKPSFSAFQTGKNISNYTIDKKLEAQNGYKPVIIGFEKEMQGKPSGKYTPHPEFFHWSGSSRPRSFFLQSDIWLKTAVSHSVGLTLLILQVPSKE